MDHYLNMNYADAAFTIRLMEHICAKYRNHHLISSFTESEMDLNRIKSKKTENTSKAKTNNKPQRTIRLMDRKVGAGALEEAARPIRQLTSSIEAFWLLRREERKVRAPRKERVLEKRV